MPYQRCPTCRLAVHVADGEGVAVACPRCGRALVGEPRSSHVSPPAALDLEAVRTLLAQRGGRFHRRPGARTGGRPASGPRRAA